MAAPRVTRSASAALARPAEADRPAGGGGAGVELSGGALAAIRELIQSGNAQVIASLEARFEHLENALKSWSMKVWTNICKSGSFLNSCSHR